MTQILINSAFLTKKYVYKGYGISLGDKRLVNKHQKIAFQSGLISLLLNAIATNHIHLSHFLKLQFLSFIRKSNFLLEA